MDQKKRYQVTIMSAVDELQRCFKSLNQLYFGGQLEDVIITIQTDPKRQAYAWISVDPRWNDKTEAWYREINIVAEWLNREPENIVASLLHEMCHLWNLQRGIQDCSRGGSYHNTVFRDTALSHGLTCGKDHRYGWTITGPSPELIEWAQKNVRKGCFRFRRAMTWADGTPKKVKEPPEGEETGKPAVEKKGKSNILRYTCPTCGLIVRASRNIDGKLICADCVKKLQSEGSTAIPFLVRS